MKLSTMWAMMGGTAAPFFLRSLRLMAPVHRVAWLAAASKHGVIDQRSRAAASTRAI